MSVPGPGASLKLPDISRSEQDRQTMPPPPSPPLLPLPPLDIRWMHAGSQHLDLPINPITTVSTTYKAFSFDESLRIEARWESLREEERAKAIKEWGSAEGEGAPSKVAKKTATTNGRARSGSNASSASEKESTSKHPVDVHSKHRRRSSLAKGEMPDTEVIRSGEEQKGVSDEEEKETDGDRRYKALLLKAQDDVDTIAGVPVSQDSMFEVSLTSLSLHPVFWAHTGPRVSVLRGTWFIGDDTRPSSWELAEEIEKGYLEIRPWQPSYKHELATATALGAAAEEKLKYPLPARFGQGVGVIFEDGEKGRLVTTGALTYLSRAFWSSLRTKPSGTYVYRGYGAARAASGKDKDDASAGRRSASASRRGSNASVRSTGGEKGASGFYRSVSRSGRRLDEPESSTNNAPKRALEDGVQSTKDAVNDVKAGVKKGMEEIVEAARIRKQSADSMMPSAEARKAMEEEHAPIVDSSEDDTPCTDLILVIHGIGQQLAMQYEAYNFVYAGNQLRQVLRKQTDNPALASIVRDRRCQVLPVQWRASLQLDQEKTQEDREHDMDNRFTMADITINKSIPYVRELTNSVLLDIPLFMSHHRQKMIEAVCIQANKLYRLWIARNPDFEKYGRVHIIGHSLGSALAAHILSNQPTKMPSLTQLPKQVITKTKDRFLFNTSSYFMVGSPLGIFLHLDQAQLMPRKGRARTMHSPQDEALDRSGKFGCLAVDSIYNIFYYTDPVAYKLNAVVDAALASKMQPLGITSVTAPFYATVTDGFSTITKYLPTLPFSSGSNTPSAPEKKPGARPSVIRLPSGIEMSGPSGQEKLEGGRGERRFSALNPHGNIDFFLPTSGPSEYLDMITAHASYWSDASFAAFLLAEIFSTRLDVVRTGMGLARSAVPEMEML